MELLTDEIIKQALEADGFMEEPDASWLLEYINTEYGSELDTDSSWCDDERPYVSQDGYYYEDHNEWADRAIEELTSGCDVWISPDIWSDMEYDFNYNLEAWWPDIYEEKFNDKREELLDSGEYTENEHDE